ncbi:MAG: hypothetical protein JJE04_03065 [Acidobacteriia bacterium]|nr:hypothetical protein [Terriglobia bacterium]
MNAQKGNARREPEPRGAAVPIGAASALCALRVPVVVLLLLLFISGCGKNDPTSSIDTPDSRWKAALATFAKGDLKKTGEHLEWLTQTDNQYLQQARGWRLVLLSGMVRGYVELVDSYRKASAGKPADPMQMQRYMETLKKASASQGSALGQCHADFEKAHPEGEVILSFPIPSFSTMTLPAGLDQVAAGSPLYGPQAESLEEAALQWGLTQAICETAGSPGNLEQARQLFRTLPVRLPRAVFELGMASGIYQASFLFGPAALDDSQRRASLLYQARIAVAKAPAGPETDAVATKIQQALNEKH